MTPSSVATAATLAALVAGCALASPDPTPASPPPPAATSITATPTPDIRASNPSLAVDAVDAAGITTGADGDAPIASNSTSPVTVAGPTPPLPADLATTQTTLRGPNDDDGEPVEAMTAGDVAVAWLIERHTGRYDDPPADRLRRLTALAADPATAATAAAAVADTESDATWPIVGAVEDVGGGWWRISFTVKQLIAGHVGPASTAATLEVHVNEVSQVDGERP